MRSSTLPGAGANRDRRAPPRSPLIGYLAAAAGVVVVSLLIDLIVGRIHVASIPMLYLLIVLATAVRFGSGPAVLASVLAFLAYNWFFIEPTATFAAGGAIQGRSGKRLRLLSVPYAFVLLNLAALVGGLRFLRGDLRAAWNGAGS